MLMTSPVKIILLASVIGTLGACGGGEIASTPPPVAGPPSLPPPPSSPPTSSVPRFGLNGDADFPAVGDAVEFRWSAAQGAYTMVTATSSDQLTLGGNDASAEDHWARSGDFGVTLRKDLEYKYTNLATLLESGWGSSFGTFAYGIPTAANDVPVTGSASYTALVNGGSPPNYGYWDYWVKGEAKLTFDFGTGTLGGYFDPTISSSGIDYTPLGRYHFTNTVFGVGSTTFSGNLQHGSIEGSGSFNGLFTGPQASELMAKWSAPFVNPSNGQMGTIAGVWIGKKD